jgi:proton-translocating NADH-quinone oxidoreductase chain N
VIVLPLFILAPLAGIVLLNLPPAAALRKRAFAVPMVLSLLQAAIVIWGPADFWSWLDPLARFLSVGFKTGALSRLVLLSIAVVLFAAVRVGQSTIAEARRRSHFVNLLLLAQIGMNGTVLVTDLFSLYVFVEITSISSFVLIAFDRERKALEGAFKYILLSAVATVLMLTSVALLLVVAGGTGFTQVAGALKTSSGAVLAKMAVGSFVCGLFIKGGLVPFHGWVLGAYSAAPAASSVLLAGIATKASGIYALVRLVATVFPPSLPLNQALLLVGTVSIVVGALAALGQSDLKRMLAYSSISQVGYIVLGLGCGTALGVAGAAFHLFNHAIFKSLLFVNSAALERRLGTTDMNRMGGLGSRMPVTGVTSVIAVLSTAGVPPFSGFWSKLIIVVALWEAHHYTYAAVAVLMGVVTLAYLLVLQRRVFFGKVPEDLALAQEAGGGLAVPEIVLAAVTTGAGLLFPLLLKTFLVPIGGIL